MGRQKINDRFVVFTKIENIRIEAIAANPRILKSNWLPPICFDLVNIKNCNNTNIKNALDIGSVNAVEA